MFIGKTGKSEFIPSLLSKDFHKLRIAVFYLYVTFPILGRGQSSGQVPSKFSMCMSSLQLLLGGESASHASGKRDFRPPYRACSGLQRI